MSTGKSSNSLQTLPGDWEERLAALESTREPSPRIAVFDLDNTLLIHDLGEAVFTRLRGLSLEGAIPGITEPLPLSWPQYIHMRESGDRREAYCRCVTAMAGLKASFIRQTTREVMNRPGEWLEADGVRIPVPRIDPLMKSLLQRLDRRGFDLFIISASNHISVRTVAAEFFGISPQRAWGIRALTRVDETGAEILTPELSEPVPYGTGKPRLYARELGDTPPLVSAGDSLADIPLLNLTAPGGLVIWAGDPETLRHDPSRFSDPSMVFPHPGRQA